MSSHRLPVGRNTTVRLQMQKHTIQLSDVLDLNMDIIVTLPDKHAQSWLPPKLSADFVPIFIADTPVAAAQRQAWTVS